MRRIQPPQQPNQVFFKALESRIGGDRRQHQLLIIRGLPEANHVDTLKLAQNAKEGRQRRLDQRLAVVFKRHAVHADVERALCEVGGGRIRGDDLRSGVSVGVAPGIEELDEGGDVLRLVLRHGDALLGRLAEFAV